MPQIIDTLHLMVAVLPLACYLLVLGLLNLAARPIVVSGMKDTLALGLAVSGMVIAGPLELFVPVATAFRLGGYVWPLLGAFYGMSLLLLVLLRRPRIVIYNAGPEQIRPLLAKVLADLDPDARWAGDCLYLPALGVQLHIEGASLVRNIQLVSAGAAQSLEGWARLETALRQSLRQRTGPRNLYGVSLVIASVALFAIVTFSAVRSPVTVTQLREMLHVGP